MEFDVVNMQIESDMMDQLNTQDIKADDMDDYFNKIIGVYKDQFPDWQKQYAGTYGEGGTTE